MTALTLVAAGLVSWLLRVALITVLPARHLPDPARRILDQAAPAAMAALVATALAGDGGAASLVTPSPVLGATLLAGAVAWRTRRLALTVAVGVASLWVLSLVFR